MIHSLTGASSASRWMKCNGYLNLMKGMPDDMVAREDPDWTREGTAAHEVAALCLRNGKDAWEFTGALFDGIVIGEEDGQASPSAIQEYVDECRQYINGAGHWIETSIDRTKDHFGFFGTLDFCAVDDENEIIRIRDLKFGKGVFVSPDNNVQLKYYAYAMLLKLDDDNVHIPLHYSVELGIVQPRYWNEASIRTWTTTVAEILIWGQDVLMPAIEKAHDVDQPVEYVPGEHCKFCPVKTSCPAMKGLASIAAGRSKSAGRMSNAELGAEFACIALAEMYHAELKAEVLSRLQTGQDIPGAKLVRKRADRIWKNGALPALCGVLGNLAMTAPELKSPAQMEKISNSAKKLVSKWAFVPNTGFTVAPEGDRRPRETPVTLAAAFSDLEGKQF